MVVAFCSLLTPSGLQRKRLSKKTDDYRIDRTMKAARAAGVGDASELQCNEL